MTRITRIRLEDYRCFHSEQVAILKPLTLLVGENSTGKTSFMAMLRALNKAACRREVPDFKEEPYDLGSFDEIAHKRGARGGQARIFKGGFDTIIEGPNDKQPDLDLYSFDIQFVRQGTIPVPQIMRHSYKQSSFEEYLEGGQIHKLIGRTSKGAWEKTMPEVFRHIEGTESLIPPPIIWSRPHPSDNNPEYSEFIPISNSPDMSKEDFESIQNILYIPWSIHRIMSANSPVRSKPKRTYDPSNIVPDSEGNYMPMFLNYLSSQDEEKWRNFKAALEQFGQSAGLFDEIHIKQLDNRSSGPFQVQIRKFDRQYRGSYHNLIDMGYGVSQVLPVITDLWRESREREALFLLQQPEVHLHPKAQASLGTLFCSRASMGDQLIVETHSDHIVDRIRMEVRDRVFLSPQDVSILFFERVKLDVRIHSLGLSAEGNVIALDSDGNEKNVPTSYRNFFLEEMKRSIGLS